MVLNAKIFFSLLSKKFKYTDYKSKIWQCRLLGLVVGAGSEAPVS